MTEVEFHTGVADPLAFACRLLRKAQRQGVRVIVTAPAPALALLDRQLWTFDERDFVPHVRMPGAPAATAELTPIWLAATTDGLAGAPGAPKVLVNLDADGPADPRTMARVIEIVGAQDELAERGRERWRAYKAAGLPVRHHAPADHG